jgi:hypothetical protein
MKRITIVAAVFGAALLALAGVATAAPNAGVICTDNSLAGQTVMTNVTVPANSTCDLSWADVHGNVTVNGSLVTYGITHFGGNVQVNQGGSFAASNWGVTIDGNLSFLNPATYSYNGFWGNQGGTSNLVKGNINYTITSGMQYPMYQSPLLYFGGGTHVNGNLNYSDQGTGFPGHLDTGGLTVGGHINVS